MHEWRMWEYRCDSGDPWLPLGLLTPSDAQEASFKRIARILAQHLQDQAHNWDRGYDLFIRKDGKVRKFRVWSELVRTFHAKELAEESV